MEINAHFSFEMRIEWLLICKNPMIRSKVIRKTIFCLSVCPKTLF